MARRGSFERDWKKLRSTKDEKLNIACAKIFKKVEKLLKNDRKTRHERYLALWKIMRREDREIGRMFDDLKRSNATSKLIAWRQNGLLSDEELAQFSEQT